MSTHVLKPASATCVCFCSNLMFIEERQMNMKVLHHFFAFEIRALTSVSESTAGFVYTVMTWLIMHMKRVESRCDGIQMSPEMC